MHRLLQELCEDKRPVTLTAGRPTRIFYGRLVLLTDIPAGLEVELLDCPDNLAIEAGNSCTVVFADGFRTRLFVSTFVDVPPPAGPRWRVRLGMPECILPAEIRSAWRIPLGEDTPLRVTVRCRDRAFVPHPMDISSGGLLAQFEPDSDAPTWIGDHSQVDVELQLNGLEASLEALPQRRGEAVYAFYFAEVLREMRHGRTGSPKKLVPILDQLESQWLDQR